jgi:hypothetical protein
VDFEFRQDPGERPIVWCMVAYEIFSGRELRYWRDDLINMQRSPFDTGPDVVVVAYYAPAEWSCFLALGWPLPAVPLDLFAEFRVAVNRFIPRELRGKVLQRLDGRSLYSALQHYGLEVGDVDTKQRMRDLAMTKTMSTWCAAEIRDLIEYCADDVHRTANLFLKMWDNLDWPQARLRGLYTLAVAVIEYLGIPMGMERWGRLQRNWTTLRLTEIADIEAHYGYQFYVDGSFGRTLFERYLAERGKLWPYENGKLKLDDRTFGKMARIYRELQFLQQRRAQITELNVAKIAIGSDSRHRAVPSSIFRTATGRTQPRNFIMGYNRWVRFGMRPPEGYGMALIDYRGQEWGAFGALAGDEWVIDGYKTGQPYIKFMIDAGYAPEGATGDSHPELEAVGKVICLGSIFGLTEHKAAPRLGVSRIEARTLLKQHARLCHVGWRWRDRTYAAAVEDRLMVTKFGWKWRPVPYISEETGRVTWPSKRVICNFSCQGHGADMIRIAAILTVAAGVELVATVHDALMITAPLARFPEAIAITKECMITAARTTIGMELFVDDIARVEWPDYFHDKKGAAIWARIGAKLDTIEPE